MPVIAYLQEEVNQKTLVLIIKTNKLTLDVLRKVVAGLAKPAAERRAERKAEKRADREAERRNMKQEELNRSKLGKVTVQDLAAQNAGMTNIEITNKNIKGFERYARRYGVSYALKKDKSKDPPVYLVFFKGRDQDAISAAFRDFSTAEIKKANKPSLHQRLEQNRVKVAAQKKKNRAKHKNLEQAR